MPEMRGRTAIAGGPRTGKSTLARFMRAAVMSTDPEGDVKEPLAGVEYVPRDVMDAVTAGERWSAASQYVADRFLSREGPWTLEGVGVARALRKFHEQHPAEAPPIDRLIVLTQHHETLSPGQVTMTKGVHTVLAEIEPWLREHGIPVERR